MKQSYKPTNLSLGRWNIENCKKRTFIKTDYSNEDHCGVCSIKESMEGSVQNNSRMTIYYKEESENDEEHYRYYLV
jgi:hypothetical protein